MAIFGDYYSATNTPIIAINDGSFAEINGGNFTRTLYNPAVSIIFVDDRHNGQSYHYFGRNQKRKNEAKILEMPELVDFFDAKHIVIYCKTNEYKTKGLYD